jgi:hypothetical protein
MARKTLFVTASVLAATLASAGEPKVKRPDLEVVLLADGGWTPTPMHYFMLKVNFSGEIEGGGDLNPGLPAPPPRLSASAHATIAAILDKERFFALPNRNLGCVPDLGGRTIEAWRGTKQRRVSFCVETPGLQRREVQSILRIWYGVLNGVANGRRVPVADADKRFVSKEP